jgi:amino acid adenylation domain-containing protein
LSSKTNLIESVYPLSPLQQGFLFHSQLNEGIDPYCVQQCYLLGGYIDIPALKAAWQHLAQRHAVLRTAFAFKSQREPMQLVKREVTFNFKLLDWTHIQTGIFQSSLDEFLAADRKQGFDLTQAPLMRIQLIRTARKTHYLVKTYHHIITDGWSSAIMMRELAVIYQAQLQGERLVLPSPSPYRNYIRWLQKQDQQAAKRFWRHCLKDFDSKTSLSLPKAEGGSAQIMLENLINTELSKKLHVFTRQQGLTLNTLFQAAWALLLARYSSSQQVVFGVTVAGRPTELAESESMVGLFINTLPLSIKIGATTSVIGLLKAIQKLSLDMQHYAYLPLAEIQGLSDLPSGESLFDTLLIFENYAKQSVDSQADTDTLLKIERISLNDETHYPLTLYVIPGECIQLRLWYNSARFTATSMSQLLMHLENLLTQLVSVVNADTQIADIDMLSLQEYQQFIKWNETYESYEFAKSLPQLFAKQAKLYANEPALLFNKQSISYEALNNNANRLAHALRQLDIGLEDRVGIYLERGPRLVTAVLGLLKAGITYVPLDPSYPQTRLKFMIADADLALIVTEQTLAKQNLRHLTIATLCFDRDVAMIGTCSHHTPSIIHKPQNLAYIIYTSGSTGQPKAVQITHCNILNFLFAMQQQLSFEAKQTWLAVTSLSFDISVLELWLPLLYGGRVAIADKSAISDATQLIDLLKTQQIDWMQATPATWNMLFDSGWQGSTRLNVLCGGEAMPEDLAIRLLATCNRLWNVYGPTETTVWSTSCELQKDQPLARIGTAIANTEVHILDSTLQQVPVGVVGDLYIGGDGVARGYRSRAGLTAERFIPDPFSSDAGKRLYYTGDLARRYADGSLEYLGRVDSQIKLRGYRIELGEIEHVLQQYPAITDAAVVLQTEQIDEPRLLAYWVTNDTSTNEEALRSFLRERLASPMLPARLIQIECMPLTANGKLDRKRLPMPEQEQSGSIFDNESSMTQQLLATIWADLLGVKWIKNNANFFDLGGHSLLATRLVARVRVAFKRDMPLRAVFEESTFVNMARLIDRLILDGNSISSEPIQVAPKQQDYPLSFEQERLYFLYQLDRSSSAYHLPLVIAIDGQLDRNILNTSFIHLCENHSSLHSYFKMKNGEARQCIGQVDTVIAFKNLSALEGEEQQVELDKMLQKHRQQAFDLEQDAPLRALCICLSDQQHVLSLVIHHIAADGWSLHLLLNQLNQLYLAELENTHQKIIDKPDLQYIDYAHWQRFTLREDVFEKVMAYWKQRLQGAPALLEMPTDRPRNHLEKSQGARLRFSLSQTLSRALYGLCRRFDVTLFMFLLAVFKILLSRYSGQNDISIGTVVANRNRPELENIIGSFVNTLVLRSDLSGEQTFNQFLKQVRDTTLGAYAHQHLPFERLVDALQPVRSANHSPLFQVAMGLQNTPNKPIQNADLRLSTLPSKHVTAIFDMTLHIVESAETIQSTLEFNKTLFEPQTIERFIDCYQTLLESVVRDPSQHLSQLSLLSDLDYQSILLRKQKRVSYSGTDSLVGCFENLALIQPRAIAVSFKGEILNYENLNKQANRLAHFLISKGINTESPVGLSCNPSLNLLIGILGILKAGGCYVPLDPRQPKERLQAIIVDAGIRWIVHDEVKDNIQNNLLLGSHALISLDSDQRSGFSNNNPDIQILSQQLAYVIYTSGSTGVPKGVGISHSQVVQMFRALEMDFEFLPTDIWTMFHAYSFDVSVWELWGALLYGGQIVIVPYETRRSPEAFARLLKDENITILSQTPSALYGLFDVLLDTTSPANLALRYIVFGGELLDANRLLPWFKRYGDEKPQLINMYGATETTINVSYRRFRMEDAESVSGNEIGLPLNNLQAYVMDRYQQLLPLGVAGELYVGGTGVGRGYFARQSLTATCFIPDPYSQIPGSRLYKTRDKAICCSDGSLRYLGRLDNQVQLRGFRIELGEIEAALLNYSEIKEVVVIIREDLGCEPLLVAYIVGKVDVAKLRSHVARFLPDYMVPGRYMEIEALPLTANGKLDRDALPKPNTQIETHQYVAPRNRLEQILADLWSEVLDIERVGIEDNFFELGGNSLSVLRLMELVHRHIGGDFPLSSLFESPTISAFTKKIMRFSDMQMTPLVRLRTGSTSMPLYCFHPAGGHVMGYKTLAENWQGDQAIYGIQARSLLDSKDKAPSIETMASDYARVIRSNQPAGPYALVGWSMGGVIALAVAKQLELDNQTIAFLGLVDPPLNAAAQSKKKKVIDNKKSDIIESYALMLGAQKNDRILHSLTLKQRELLSSKLIALKSDDARLQYMLDFAHSKKLVSPNYNLNVVKWRQTTLELAQKQVEEHQIDTVMTDLHLWVSKQNLSSQYSVTNKNQYTTGKLFLEKVDASHTDIIHSAEIIQALELKYSTLILQTTT